MSTTQSSTTKDDILQYLLKEGEATAQSLSEALHVTPQAVRRHLKDLTEEQLIVHHAVQAKMGRPQHIYHLSREGRSRFPANYDQFAVSLLRTLSETVPPEQFRTIIKIQWQKKISEYRDQLGEGSLRSRLQKLVALRYSEGFMSEVHQAEDQEDQGAIAPETQAETQAGNPAKPQTKTQTRPRERFIVTEYNCAIAQVAESFPTICGQELELFTSLFPDCTVERTHWMIKGKNYCGYLIQAKA